MERLHMSNNERQARSKNLQEQQQLRKQLEELSLKEISKKNVGRVEEQKWRQFLKDCIKNTGNCSLAMEQTLKGNMSTSEQGNGVLSRQRSRSESQLYINYPKSMAGALNSKAGSTTCFKLADSGRMNQYKVHPQEISELSMSYHDMTERETLANLHCNTKTDLEVPKPTWGKSTLLLASRRSRCPRSSVIPSSDTVVVEHADLALCNSVIESEGTRSSLASHVAQTLESTIHLSNSKPKQVLLNRHLRADCDSQQVRSVENRLSLPNNINNFQRLKAQHSCYQPDNAGRVEHEYDRHTDETHEDVRRTNTSRDNLISVLSASLTGNCEELKECSTPSLNTTARNSHQRRRLEKLRKMNAKGEIKYFNNINKSYSGVVSPCSTEFVHRETATDMKFGSTETGQQDTSYRKLDLIDMKKQYSTSGSVTRQDVAKIQRPREISMKSKAHLATLETENQHRTMSDKRSRKVKKLLEISSFVNTPPQTSNEPNMEVINLADDQTVGDRKCKGSTEFDTEIDLCQFGDQYSVTVPKKERLASYDSNNLISTKLPLLSKDPDNPDRIIISQLDGIANPLTSDWKNRCSGDDGKLEARQLNRTGNSSRDYKTRKQSSESVGSTPEHFSLNLEKRYLSNEDNEKIPLVKYDKSEQRPQNLLVNDKIPLVMYDNGEERAKNVLVDSACRPRTLKTLLPENIHTPCTSGDTLNTLLPENIHTPCTSGDTLNTLLPENIHTLCTSGDTLNTLLPENIHTSCTSGDTLNTLLPENIHTSCTSGDTLNRVIESQAGGCKDSNRCLNTRTGKQKIERIDIDRTVKCSQMKMAGAQTTPTPTNHNRESTGPGSIRDQVGNIAANTEVLNHGHKSAREMSFDINKYKTQSQRLADYQQPTQSGCVDLSYSRKTSLASLSQTSKHSWKLQRSRQSNNLLFDNRHSNKPNNMLSDSRCYKEASTNLSGKKHSITSVISDSNLRRKSLSGSSNVEHSKKQITINMRKSAEKLSNTNKRISSNVLSDINDSEKSANILSNINHLRESSINNMKESNSFLSQNIKYEDMVFQRFTANSTSNRVDNNVCVNDINHSNNNDTDNTSGARYNNVMVNQTVCDTNQNTRLCPEYISLHHSHNMALVEDSTRVSNISDLKLRSVMTISSDVNRQVTLSDLSSLSHVKENCDSPTMRQRNCRTAQQHRQLHRCWKTAGSRIVTCNQLYNRTISADVMMSKKCRQRVIAQMVEHNLKRPINNQKMLADVALRMRIEKFLRSF